jgi:hypothetical protein
VVLLAADSPLAALGRASQAVRNQLARKRPPLTGLPERLLLPDSEGDNESNALLGTLVSAF